MPVMMGVEVTIELILGRVESAETLIPPVSRFRRLRRIDRVVDRLALGLQHLPERGYPKCPKSAFTPVRLHDGADSEISQVRWDIDRFGAQDMEFEEPLEHAIQLFLDILLRFRREAALIRTLRTAMIKPADPARITARFSWYSGVVVIETPPRRLNGSL